MPLKLTIKALSKSKIDPSLPTSDVVVAGVSASFTNVPLGGTFSPIVILNNYVVFRLRGKVATNTCNYRITKTDGVTILASFIVQPSTVFTTTTTNAIKVTNVSDWVDIKLQVQTGATGPVNVTTEQDNIFVMMAQYINPTDDLTIKRHVDSIFFFSSQASESLNGLTSDKEDLDFQELIVNGLMSDFIWSTNSGNTIYSWGGLTIGVEQ